MRSLRSGSQYAFNPAVQAIEDAICCIALDEGGLPTIREALVYVGATFVLIVHAEGGAEVALTYAALQEDEVLDHDGVLVVLCVLGRVGLVCEGAIQAC